MTQPPDTALPHWLSFDVEEYFQVEAAAARLDRSAWDSLPSRLEEPLGRILDLLAAHQARATFFVLGWVARRSGELVRRIAHAGHEIASHGMSHQMLHRLSPASFRQELSESRRVLEDLSGRAVAGFRSPTFSITHATAWAIDVLAEESFAYDSSVFPIRHDRYGVPEAPRDPHVALGPGGGRILELPLLTLRALGANWPVAGGGYLRLLPVGLTARGLRAARRRGQCGMIYLHPWEFDPDQPPLPMAPLSRLRHRVNLHRTESKLHYLLDRFGFAPAGESLDALRSATLPTFRYGRP